MKLWLDDIRDPVKYGHLDAVWARTAEEAIGLLKTGEVSWASLDHDLAWEHYPWNSIPEKAYREKTGYYVVCWMEENNVWPKDGVEVHSMNPIGRERMLQVIQKYYGK